MLMRRFHTHAGSALAAAILMLTASACGGGDPKGDPSPTSTVSSSPTSSSPTPTWDAKFSPAQLQRYQEARARWMEYWAFYTEAARKGVDTPSVMAGFEKYSMAPLSEHSQFLDTYVNGGARMEVAPKVLWTSASKIGPTSVVFNYCLDYTDARITTNGQVNEITDPSRRLVKVQMRKTTKGWMKERYVDQGVEPCAPTAP
ncbi:hypothetical protein K8Z61_12785 [Nocardioides sp. TRM66260-LWL]|uniref:hypothetical protein n=1 Tax=Nocardioides sp. TRM66260-LWL TaxID=2874478 RepID=UPI001CC785A2|nr:hypothetical protein [Nocardioides sp. TRM66260-LWL]MBZ5735373.1 hypothetical protein [Nocardioides sp. TRM66260-LWL]